MSLTTADKQEMRILIREETTDLRQEVYRLGILYEDLDGKLDTALEILHDMHSIPMQVADHEQRISLSEENNRILRQMLLDHTMQASAHSH